MEITEKIKEGIDSGTYGCGIFIDPRKAFDTVNHDIILNNLNVMESEVYFLSGLNHI